MSSLAFPCQIMMRHLAQHEDNHAIGHFMVFSIYIYIIHLQMLIQARFMALLGRCALWLRGDGSSFQVLLELCAPGFQSLHSFLLFNSTLFA